MNLDGIRWGECCTLIEIHSYLLEEISDESVY